MDDPETRAGARLASSFGYQEVKPEDKSRRVRAVFESVAGHYDLMNDLMSLGVHRLWKRSLIDWLAPRPGLRLLDVAGGTGDIAWRVWDEVTRRGGAAPRIVICDINAAMLETGRDRALDDGRLESFEWLCADAEALPVPARSFDAYTIAFGIRNVTHLDRALAEAYRVLRPGGRFLCLEFSRFRLDLMAPIYDAYSFGVLSQLGAWVAGDRAAYQYLAESIRRFPNQAAFATLIEQAGFAKVRHRNLSGGIAALHSGWRI